LKRNQPSETLVLIDHKGKRIERERGSSISARERAEALRSLPPVREGNKGRVQQTAKSRLMGFGGRQDTPMFRSDRHGGT